jgi:segregation and condensation protein A
MAYSVKVKDFEGPFDLLLGLIESRELSINEIYLAEITDQYLDYLKGLESFPLEEVASFVVVASTLMLIKSRSLLPSLEITTEEEKSITELEDRLKIYQKIRELALGLQKNIGKEPMFEREAFKGFEINFLEPEGVNIEKLHSLLQNVLASLPVKEKLPEVEVKKIITLEEKILELTDRIQNSLQMSFREFAGAGRHGAEIKAEIIVSFLAMLELVKQGIIMVKQEENFDNISISKIEVYGETE